MQLRLELTLHAGRGRSDRDVEVEGVVTNTGSNPVELDLVELGSPPLALDIVDANGVPFGRLPPPTPGRVEAAVLAPGAQRSVRFRGFMTGAPAGRYRARFRYRHASSRWVELEIRPRE